MKTNRYLFSFPHYAIQSSVIKVFSYSKAQYLYIFLNKGLIKGTKSSQHIAKESFGLNEKGPKV